ncbi:MAG: thioesterase family protein [Nocardioides sp.]
MEPAAYFTRLDEHRVAPTAHTGGAWALDEQHVSPSVGLAVHEVERSVAARGGDGLVTARVSADILGTMRLDEPMDVRVEVVRPGRTIALHEAVVVTGGRPALRVRVWRLAPQDTAAVAGGAGDPLPDPATVGAWDMTSVWPGGYIASLDVRAVRPPAPGRSTTWVTSPVALIAGEPVSPLARWVGLVDTANGTGVRRDPRTWMFPNVDLTLHLHRQPEGAWLGLDTQVVFGPAGQGLTSSVLHDVHGPVGRAEQVLTVRPLAP